MEEATPVKGKARISEVGRLSGNRTRTKLMAMGEEVAAEEEEGEDVVVEDGDTDDHVQRTFLQFGKLSMFAMMLMDTVLLVSACLKYP